MTDDVEFDCEKCEDGGWAILKNGRRAFWYSTEDHARMFVAATNDDWKEFDRLLDLIKEREDLRKMIAIIEQERELCRID